MLPIRLWRWLLLATLLVGLIILIAASLFHRWLNSPQKFLDSPVVFVVHSGESLTSVSRRLEQQQIIHWPTAWRLYAKFYESRPVRAGEYRIPMQLSPVAVLRLLQSGKVITYDVTLVEGKTFNDFVRQLHQQEKLTSLLYGQDMQRQLALLDLPISHPEGWFYPETYQYVAGDTDIEIMRRAYRKMVEVIAEEWPLRQKDVPYSESYQALIMASIVEKETGAASERAQIAGVFVRRLQQGMRLQTDPTVIYGLAEAFHGNLTRKHLREPSQYNTYVHRGLPPTPIAMPGRDAIHAALHPADGAQLYFVARGDGTHYFSATLEEHNKAVDQYQRRVRVKDYRSAPQ